MKPEDFELYFKKEEARLKKPNNFDGIKAGNPKQEIIKAAVSWKASWDALKIAKDCGCNFFITHESVFVNGSSGNEIDPPKYHELEREKAQWIIDSGMCIFRCHDVIDHAPVVGIRDQWIKGLGFNAYEIVTPSELYAFCRIPPVRLEDLVSSILKKVRPLGQNGVMVTGNPDRLVRTVMVGCGAKTEPFDMIPYNPDCILVTDDYFRTVRDGEFVRETGTDMIMLNHGVSEEWGIAAYTKHLQNVFPSVELIHIPHKYIFKVAT